MRMHRLLVTATLVGVGSLIACGGAKPVEPVSPSTPAPAASSAAPSESASAPAETSKPAVAEETSSRSPVSILTDADATWVLAFDQSDAGKAAETKCTESSKGDDKKQGACMRTARARMPVEAMRFVKDEEAGMLWQFLAQKGGNYTVVSKLPVEFGEESANAVVVKPKKGKGGSGTPPWGVATKETKLEVPNNFSVVVTDPTQGKTVYEAKIILQQGK